MSAGRATVSGRFGHSLLQTLRPSGSASAPVQRALEQVRVGDTTRWRDSDYPEAGSHPTPALLREAIESRRAPGTRSYAAYGLPRRGAPAPPPSAGARGAAFEEKHGASAAPSSASGGGGGGSASAAPTPTVATAEWKSDAPAKVSGAPSGSGARRVGAQASAPGPRRLILAGYTIRLAYANRVGACRLEVTHPDEKEIVGYANFTIERRPAKAAPAPDEPYTDQHFLGRVRTAANLKGIFNTTLMRPGPADIYQGFGNRLMQEVEMVARRMGARYLYLAPSESDVRNDPNTADMVTQDPTGFYLKHGYGYDAIVLTHNASASVYGAEAARLTKMELQGMLSKEL